MVGRDPMKKKKERRKCLTKNQKKNVRRRYSHNYFFATVWISTW